MSKPPSSPGSSSTAAPPDTALSELAVSSLVAEIFLSGLMLDTSVVGEFESRELSPLTPCNSSIPSFSFACTEGFAVSVEDDDGTALIAFSTDSGVLLFKFVVESIDPSRLETASPLMLDFCWPS